MDVEIDDPDSDTQLGAVFGLLERTPIVGDTVDALGYTFEATQMQGYRVSCIKVTPLPEEETTEEEHEEALMVVLIHLPSSLVEKYKLCTL